MVTFCLNFHFVSTTMLTIVEFLVGVIKLKQYEVFRTLKIYVVQGREVGDDRKCEKRSGGLVPLL